MGRHSAPTAPDAPARAPQPTPARPAVPTASAAVGTTSVDRAVPVRSTRTPLAVQGAAEPRRATAPSTPRTSAWIDAATPRPVAARPAEDLPALHSPVRALGTPATQPVPLLVPGVDAPSIHTGPIALTGPAQPVRRRRVTRVALGVAALAIVAGVVAQATAQRSDAAPGLLPFDGGGLTTSGAPADPTSSAPGSPTTAATTSGTASVAVPSPTGPRTGPSTASPSGTPSGATPTARTSASAPSTPSAASTAPRRSATASPGASTPAPRDPEPSSAAPSSAPSSPEPSSPKPAGGAATGSLRAALASDSGKDLPAGVLGFADFGSNLLGVDLRGRLTGAGSAQTTLRMTPKTSTRASRVPTKAWTTNQLSLIRISAATTVRGFTLQGTNQGHLYNGLRIASSTGARVSDVRVLSVPGDDDIPPGETFGINDFRTNGTRYSDVEVDGSGISGATFGTNNSNDVVVTDSFFHDAGHSNGATFWQTRNVTVRNTTSVRNKDAAFNFERVSGSVVLDHVTMRDNDLADLRINSDKGSADYRIIDPVLGGKKLTILMTPKYMGAPNRQKKSDVHVIVNGVDRTDDLVRWVDHF